MNTKLAAIFVMVSQYKSAQSISKVYFWLKSLSRVFDANVGLFVRKRIYLTSADKGRFCAERDLLFNQKQLMAPTINLQNGVPSGDAA